VSINNGIKCTRFTKVANRTEYTIRHILSRPFGHCIITLNGCISHYITVLVMICHVTTRYKLSALLLLLAMPMPSNTSNSNSSSREDNFYPSINQSLLRQKAAHAETRNKMLRQEEKEQYKNKRKLQTKLTAMK